VWRRLKRTRGRTTIDPLFKQILILALLVVLIVVVFVGYLVVASFR
jgi:hypothetical protein